MGEYAKRISDGEEIKIGTCEMMYYSRLSQRKDFIYPYGLNDCLWRLPWPSEDNVQVGDFYGEPEDSYMGCLKPSFNADDWERRYLVQAHTDSGILVNITCPHGGELPTIPNEYGVKLAYNGRTPTENLIRVAYVKNAKDELRLVLECKACGTKYSYPWEDIGKHLRENELTKRLFFMCVEYYWEKHKEVPRYFLDWERNNVRYICDVWKNREKDGYIYRILTEKRVERYEVITERGILMKGDKLAISKAIFEE